MFPQSTVEPVYYGHLGTSQKCPDYQGVLIFQVSLHDKVSFGITARCEDYTGVRIMQVSTFSSVLINRFHCSDILSKNILDMKSARPIRSSMQAGRCDQKL